MPLARIAGLHAANVVRQADLSTRPVQGTGTIGQYKRQMKFAASMTPAKHIKRRSLKGMARSNDGYLIGIVVEMMSAVVGSLSSSLSTGSTTTS